MYSVVLLMALNSCGDLPVMENNSGCCGSAGCAERMIVVYETPTNCTGGHGCHGGWGGRPGIVRRFFSHEPLIGTCHGGSGCCGGGGFRQGMIVAVAAAPTPLPSAPLVRTASVQASQEPIALPESAPSPWSVESEHAAAGPAAAVIVVRLPAEASLTVDGRPTHLSSSRRQFVSPPLQPGTEYSYTFRAQVNRDGEIVSASKRVRVHAGQETQIYLEFPEMSVVQR